MQPLLPLIERLSLFPAETLLAVPGQPEDTLRGVLVLRGLARQLGQDAVALRREQARLAATPGALQAEAPQLAAAQAQQQQQAAALDQQIASAEASQHAGRRRGRPTAAQRAADQRPRRTRCAACWPNSRPSGAPPRPARATMPPAAERQKQADEAAAARQRQAALERPTGAGTIASTAQPHGQLTAPVAGNDRPVLGRRHRRRTGHRHFLSGAAGGAVVSPCSGRVAFAAPFRSYGLLLIVDCGGGYHAVLAGFDRLDVKVGQTVAAGEPVGVMPTWEPGATGKRPTLYVELRRDGQPVNPAPWLKASG